MQFGKWQSGKWRPGCREGRKKNLGSSVIADTANHMNRKFAATYAQSPSMDKNWTILEKLEDETFLQIILGAKPIEAFDDFVLQWQSLGGAVITRELQDMKHN